MDDKEDTNKPVINFTSGETKRSRSAYMRHQLSELEKEFDHSKYLSRQREIELAYSTGLTEQRLRCKRKWLSSNATPVVPDISPAATTSSPDLIKKEDEEEHELAQMSINNSVNEEPSSSKSYNNAFIKNESME